MEMLRNTVFIFWRRRESIIKSRGGWYRTARGDWFASGTTQSQQVALVPARNSVEHIITFVSSMDVGTKTRPQKARSLSSGHKSMLSKGRYPVDGKRG